MRPKVHQKALGTGDAKGSTGTAGCAVPLPLILKFPESRQTSRDSLEAQWGVDREKKNLKDEKGGVFFWQAAKRG